MEKRSYVVDMQNLVHGYLRIHGGSFENAIEKIIDTLSKMYGKVGNAIYVLKARDANEYKSELGFMKQLAVKYNVEIHYLYDASNILLSDIYVNGCHSVRGKDDFHCMYLASLIKNAFVVSNDKMSDRHLFTSVVPPYVLAVVTKNEKTRFMNVNPKDEQFISFSGVAVKPFLVF